MTPQDIEKRAQYVFKISSVKIDDVFLYAAQCNPVVTGKSDFKTTRIKIVKVLTRAALLIDQDGYVIDNQKQCLLPGNMFKSLVALLEEYVRRKEP